MWVLCLVLGVHSSFKIVLLRKKKAGCFSIIVFLLSCDCLCSVSFLCGAIGWSAVCDSEHKTPTKKRATVNNESTKT